MGTINQLPTLDRPRERANRYGVDSLSDVELLALLIGKGYQGSNALEVASTLINRFNGLVNLSHTSLEELKQVKGIKDAKANIIKAIFELHNRLEIKKVESEKSIINTEYLYKKYKTILLGSHQENLVLVMLDKRMNIIHEKTLYIGTENNVIFSYKDIWRELLVHHAKYFYLIHNHPNGESTPSDKDIMFTEELFIESKRIKTPLIDHLIIGKDGYHSFQKIKRELLNPKT